MIFKLHTNLERRNQNQNVIRKAIDLGSIAAWFLGFKISHMFTQGKYITQLNISLINFLILCPHPNEYKRRTWFELVNQKFVSDLVDSSSLSLASSIFAWYIFSAQLKMASDVLLWSVKSDLVWLQRKVFWSCEKCRRNCQCSMRNIRHTSVRKLWKINHQIYSQNWKKNVHGVCLTDKKLWSWLDNETMSGVQLD